MLYFKFFKVFNFFKNCSHLCCFVFVKKSVLILLVLIFLLKLHKNMNTLPLLQFSFFYFADKRRHGDSHRVILHQLKVKVEGWATLDPVTVDKVGIYFRHAPCEMHHRVRVVTTQCQTCFYAIFLEAGPPACSCGI